MLGRSEDEVIMGTCSGAKNLPQCQPRFPPQEIAGPFLGIIFREMPDYSNKLEFLKNQVKGSIYRMVLVLSFSPKKDSEAVSVRLGVEFFWAMLSDEQMSFKVYSKWRANEQQGDWLPLARLNWPKTVQVSPGDWLPRSVVTTPNYKRSPTSVAWLSMLYCKQRAFDACFFVQGGPLLVTNGVITPINGRKKKWVACVISPL